MHTDLAPKTVHPFVCYLTLAVVCFFSFFVNNKVIPADLMESRNLATAQEMVSKSDYLIPTMNGELRLEKPPLPTWIAAGIEHVAPGNLQVQRYATGLAGTLMVFFLFALVVRLTRNRTIGLMAGLVLATCFNVILMSRTATWDIYCHCFMLGGIWLLVGALEEKGAQWGRFLLAGIFMGLSFLSKGPVSFYALFLPFILAYGFIVRPGLKRAKVFPLVVMIVACLIVSFWWPIYLMLTHPEMMMAVASKESGSWLNHNVRPIYYYWQFPAEAGIWALFWVTSLVWFFWKKEPEQRQIFKFSVVWTILAFVLLSLIPEKKTRYLLPMLIPGAINIAFYFYHSFRSMASRGERTVFRINTWVIIFILAVLPAALYTLFVREGLLSWPVFIVTTVIDLGIAVFLIRSLSSRYGIRVMGVFGGIVATMCMITSCCLIPIGHMFINEDRHSIRELRTVEQVTGLPFYYDDTEDLRMELVYEANRVILPLDIQNDSLVRHSLPFVLVSGAPADSLMAGQPVTVEYIDTYDNNWRKREHKRYNPMLTRQVSIIRADPGAVIMPAAE